ncbi:hypothetical protein GQ473_06380, partial [archaeon]|nr:hypothetical protein [archaeon]
CGVEKRQIVAGLRKNYSPGDLIGKNVCFVANLKQVKLRGVLSEGMILAADDTKNVSVLFAPKSAPGDNVMVDGLNSKPVKVMEFKEFEKINFFVTKRKTVAYKGKELKTDKELIVIKNICADAKVC